MTFRRCNSSRFALALAFAAAFVFSQIRIEESVLSSSRSNISFGGTRVNPNETSTFDADKKNSSGSAISPSSLASIFAPAPENSSVATEDDGYEPNEPILVDAPLRGYDESRLVYSLARSDRSGEVVRNMIMAHEYAFGRNLTYAGVCPMRRTHHHEKMFETRIMDTRELLQNMGLSDVLPFRCPPGISTKRSAGPEHRVPDTYLNKTFPTHLGLLPYDRYLFSQFSTETYQTYLRSQMKISTKQSSEDYTIVVHVRRGDVNPCHVRCWHRYLPNAYYLHMIDKFKSEHLKRHAGSNVDVIVYSESRPKPFEPFEDFTERGYSVRLDEPLDRVWKGIAIESNVAILSKSSFSYVPALLVDPNRTTVAYYPHYVGPKRGWRIPTDEEIDIANDGRQELQKRCERK